ncbi:MAG TPA: SHOCT domain-containing protein [Desulfosporosinus sp.]|nr:SHOCT domain-containing protein [Desulfosporosinus sp.]
MIHGNEPMIRGYGHGLMANGQYGWMGLLPVMCHLIFFIIIVVIAVILLRRHGSKVRMMEKQNDPALLILRERYALGEIDSDDYNTRKQDLSPNSPVVKK